MSYILREYGLPSGVEAMDSHRQRGALPVLREVEFKTLDEVAKYKALHQAGARAAAEGNKAAGAVETRITQLEVMKREKGLLGPLPAAENTKLTHQVNDLLEKGPGKVLQEVKAAAKAGSGVAAHFMQASKWIPGLNKFAAVGTLGGAFAGVASAKTPEQRKDAAIELGKAAMDVVDPSFGLLGVVRDGLPGAVQDIRENGARRHAESLNNPQRLAIKREQDFLFDENHPGQLAALDVKGKDGKKIDVRTALADPTQRREVLSDIDRRLAGAQSQDSKDQFRDMKEAAVSYAALEDRRRKLDEPAAQPAAVAQTPPPSAPRQHQEFAHS